MSAMEQFKAKDVAGKIENEENEINYTNDSDEFSEKVPVELEKKKKLSTQMMAIIGVGTIVFGGLMYVKFAGGGVDSAQQQSTQPFADSQYSGLNQNQEVFPMPAAQQRQFSSQETSNAALETRKPELIDSSLQLAKPSSVSKIDSSLTEVSADVKSKEMIIIETLEKKVAQLEIDLATARAGKAHQAPRESKHQTKQSTPESARNSTKNFMSDASLSRKLQATDLESLKNRNHGSNDQSSIGVTARIVPTAKNEVVKSNNGLTLYAIKDGRAWIKTPDGEIVLISAGDTIVGGIKVKSIEGDRVVTTDGIIE